jgi:hypothetical protein
VTFRRLSIEGPRGDPPSRSSSTCSKTAFISAGIPGST